MTEMIPRTNDEFCKLYGTYVADHVARLNKRSENLADIIQSVWLRLIEADVVGKFHARTKACRPEAFTTEEVCQHLGITVEAWTVAQAAYQSGAGLIPWMPSPVAGEATSTDALWSVDDVEKYEPLAAAYHEKVAESEGLIPRPTAAQFRTYVQRAVHNAFANWVRTHSRRHKERVIDLLVSVPTDHNGGMDRKIDLFDVVQDVEAPLARLEAAVEVSQTVARMRLGEREADFMALLGDGYTALEAARKLNLSRATSLRVQQVVTG